MQADQINENEMKLEFDARSVNEGFARMAVAAFVAELNPTLDEISDIKTAVSEAVTNAIIHGYDSPEEKVEVSCKLCGNHAEITVKDHGHGIADVQKAMEPFFTTRPELERSGMGFAFMEAFMDEVEVHSAPGKGTTVTMKKRSVQGWASDMEGFKELMQQAHGGDKGARDTLIAGNLGLVHTIANRFEHRGHEREELFQIGCIGLMKAVDKFDLSLNLAFSTYAVPVIMGEIRRFLRDDGMVKVSRTLKENAYKAGRAKEELWGELGREPGLLEIAERTGLSSGEIIMAMESARDVESIYQPVYEKDGDELLMVDQLCEKEENGRDEPEKEAVLNRMVIEQLMELLDEREQNLIRCRYFENRTQSETAKELGMTQVQVSRLEKKILLCLRKNLGSCNS